MSAPSSSCRTSFQDHILVRFRGAQFGTYAARRQPSYNDTIEEVRQMIFKSDPSIRWRELQLRAELEGVPAVLSSQVWPRLFAHIESVELVFPTTLPPTQATCLSTKTQQRQACVRDSRPAHRRKIVRQADRDLTLSDAEDGDLEEPHPMVVEQDHSDPDHDPDADQDQDLDADKASPVPPRVAHVSPTPQKRRRVDPSVLFSARKNLAPRALVLRSDDEDEDEREYEPQDDVELENETEHQDDAEPVDDTDTGPNHAGVFPSFDDHMRLEREQGKSYARQKDLPWVVPPAHRQRAITAYLAAGGGSNDNDNDDGDNGDKLGLLSARERHWVAKRCQRTGDYDPTNWIGRPPRVLSSGRELYDALVRAHVGSRGHRSGVSTWRSIKVPYDLPPSRPFIQSWVKLCPTCNLK